MATVTQPEPIVQYCERCQDPRAFKPKHRETYQGYEEPFPEELTLAFCPKCHFPALFGREIYGDPDDGEASDYYAVYPAEGRKVGYPLPKVVRQSYSEAVRCERSKTYMATVVMVRRALEAIAADYGKSRSTDLFAALEKMHTDGVISDEMKQWADGIRQWGNLGAHATSATVGADDARYALDFLRALMEIIYDLRPKFAAWQASGKSPRSTSPASTPKSK